MKDRNSIEAATLDAPRSGKSSFVHVIGFLTVIRLFVRPYFRVWLFPLSWS